jgi:hypothetical protein
MLCALPALAWDMLPLAVPAGAPEAAWRDALAKAWDGKTEVKIPYGRIDVESRNFVIELDFLHKWAEGMGQAAFYAESTGKQGIVALIVEDPGVLNIQAVIDKLTKIEELYNKHDLHLVVLTGN